MKPQRGRVKEGTRLPHADFDAQTFERQLEQYKERVLIDVRTPREFNDGHLPGAVNIDIYDPGFLDRVSKLDRNRATFVYCRSGSRSYSAALALTDMGFATVFNLQRGIIGWHGAVE